MAQAQGTMVPEDFEGAFAKLAEMASASEDDLDVETPAAVATEAPEGTDVEDPAEDETTSEEDGGAETADADAEGAEEEPDASAGETKLSDEEILARFAALVKKAEPQQTQLQSQPEPTTAKQSEPPLFSADEEAFLKTYEEEWPDVAKAEALRRRAEYRQLLSYVFQEVAKEFRPIMETVNVLSERTHLSDLQTAVTDYGDVRDKVIAWVDTQPAYLQAAYKHVITSGTVEEVADLVDRYKREAGVTQKPAPVSQAKTELPPATRQAAAELAPVSSKRSAVVQASDPNDFEAAFASFADKL